MRTERRSETVGFEKGIRHLLHTLGGVVKMRLNVSKRFSESMLRIARNVVTFENARPLCARCGCGATRSSVGNWARNPRKSLIAERCCRSPAGLAKKP